MWNMDFLQALKDRLRRDYDEDDDDDEKERFDSKSSKLVEEKESPEVCFGDIIVKSSVILRQLFAQFAFFLFLMNHFIFLTIILDTTRITPSRSLLTKSS